MYILRRPQNFAKSSPYFWQYVMWSKVRWRFRKILCPSHNILTLKCYFVSKLFLSMIWNSITDIATIYNILCKRRNKGFYDVLTFIPNQDTVHCEPPWWKTTSTWNLMLNDPILNVLFLCFMSLTLTPTKSFFCFYFFCRVQEVTSVEQLPLPKRTIRTTAESKNNKKYT